MKNIKYGNKFKDTDEIGKFYDTNVGIWKEKNISGSRPTVRKGFYELLGNIQGKYILDIGCGTGIDSKFFVKQGAYGIGIDISKESLELAKNYMKGNKNRKFIKKDFLDYEENGKFDIVVFSMGIMHYKEMKPIFSKVSSFLKQGGIFLLTTNNPYLVCEDFSIKYPKNCEDIKYTHMLGENKEIPVTKYIHPIINYVQQANEEGLELLAFQKQAVYGQETAAFNNPNPKDPTVPNFIAFLYKKNEDIKDLQQKKLNGTVSKIENFLTIKNFTKYKQHNICKTIYFQKKQNN